MRVRVLSEIVLPHKLILPGEILEVSESLFLKLGDRVEPFEQAGSTQPVKKTDLFCPSGGCHCSARLPNRSHPADCIRIACEYFGGDL